MCSTWSKQVQYKVKIFTRSLYLKKMCMYLLDMRAYSDPLP